jgi:hypothetical protein
MWPFDSKTSGHPHAAFDHQKIYSQLQSGIGPSGLSTAVGDWQTQVAAAFDRAHTHLTDMANKIDPVWQGEAAEGFRDSTTPLVDFVDAAKTVSQSMGNTTGSQADHFAAVKNSMPAPVKVTATDSALSRGFHDLFGGTTDAEDQEQDALNKSDEAARIYADYHDNSTSNTASLPEYPVAPQTTNVTVHDPGVTEGSIEYKHEPTQPMGPDPRTGANGPRTGSPVPGAQPFQHGAGDPGQQTTNTSSVAPLPTPQPPIVDPGLDLRAPHMIAPWTPPGYDQPNPPFVGAPGLGPIGGDQDRFGGGSRSGRGPAGFGGAEGEESLGSDRGGPGARRPGTAGPGGGPRSEGPGRGGTAAGVGFEAEGTPQARMGTGAPGRPGASGAPGMGASGSRSRSEEDSEHHTKYLIPTDEHWDQGPPVAPPVIGE